MFIRNLLMRRTVCLIFCWCSILGIPFMFYDGLMSSKIQETKAELTTLDDVFLRDFLPRKKLDFIKTPLIYNSSCQKTCTAKNWIMVTFVKSSSIHHDRRELIRNTWGALSHLNGGEFRTIFVVGKSDKENEAYLADESRKYSDILQVNYRDTYRNLVLKTLAGLQWASENMRHSDYFSTADDDVLINPLLLKKAIDYNKKLYSFTSMPIVCMYSLWTYKGVPDRDPQSKYYVSWQQYNETTWPRFCPGGMYTVSVEIARRMYEMSRVTPLLPVDDVWLTGILREKIFYPDTMVVVARPRAVVHFMGFYLKMTVKKFKQDWGNISVDIAKTAECFCYR